MSEPESGTGLCEYTWEELIALKKMGQLHNAYYVYAMLSILTPYHQPFWYKPLELRESLGAAWQTGLMPERSFRKAIVDLKNIGVLKVLKPNQKNGRVKIMLRSFKDIYPNGVQLHVLEGGKQ